MALQSLQITAMTAMRARDVSRPSSEHQETADRRPLRDEAPRKSEPRKSEPPPRGAEPRNKSDTRRRKDP